MYNQTYDDYMRSAMGYYNNNSYRNNMDMNYMNTMNNMNMNNMTPMYNMNNMNMNPNMFNDDLEHLYPEVYRVIYPMVRSSCDRIQIPGTNITDDMITRMTDDIYDRVKADGRINVEVTVEFRDNDTKEASSSETRQRRPRNRYLRDLIRILLLRELFRRRRFPGRFPIRPF